MDKPIPRDVFIELTPEQQAQLERARRETRDELPELLAQRDALRRAAAEPTLSGQIRKAVQASGLPLPMVAQQTGVTVAEMGDFLRGERPLPSDALERLAAALGFVLSLQRAN